MTTNERINLRSWISNIRQPNVRFSASRLVRLPSKERIGEVMYRLTGKCARDCAAQPLFRRGR